MNLNKTLSSLLISLLLLAIVPTDLLVVNASVNITNLLSQDMYDWYNSNAGTTGDTTYAGPYVIKALDSELYLGFNKDFPADDAGGAMLAYYNGSTLNKVDVLNEDAIYRIKSASDKIYIPGYDPGHPTDKWDAGNFYIYNPNTDTFTKKRYRYDTYQYVDSTTTDSNGIYTFTNLKNTAFMIKVINPVNYKFSPANATGIGSNPSLTRHLTDSDFDTTTGEFEMCTTTNLSAPDVSIGLNQIGSHTEETHDGGLVFQNGFAAGTATMGTRDDDFYGGTNTISSRIWTDTDGDGRQDPGEPNHAGVRVEIYTKDPYLPCSIHAPGMWVDDEAMYISYGYKNPDYKDYGGGLEFWASSLANATYKSTDGGENWEFLGATKSGYFAQDVYKFNNNLVKVWGSQTNNYDSDPWLDGWTTKFAYSSLINPSVVDWTNHDFIINHGQRIAWDGETTESIVFGYKFPVTTEMFSFKNKLIFPESSGTKITTFADLSNPVDISITGANFKRVLPAKVDPDRAPIPGTNVTYDEIGHLNNYDTFATVGDNYLYGLGAGNKLYVTTNLRNWTEVVDFDDVGNGNPPAAVEY
jgi:hypothetical protein